MFSSRLVLADSLFWFKSCTWLRVDFYKQFSFFLPSLSSSNNQVVGIFFLPRLSQPKFCAHCSQITWYRSQKNLTVIFLLNLYNTKTCQITTELYLPTFNLTFMLNSHDYKLLLLNWLHSCTFLRTCVLLHHAIMDEISQQAKSFF